MNETGSRTRLFQLSVRGNISATLFYLGRLHTDSKVLGLKQMVADTEAMIELLEKYKKAVESKLGKYEFKPTSDYIDT